MNLAYKHFLPASFADGSRVWIYQSNRPFSDNEALQINQQLQQFAEGWKSHGDEVQGFGQLLFNQFIILMADESATGVSGCSTDGSVRLMKAFEQQFAVELFNRQQLAFVVNDVIVLLPLSTLQDAAADERLNAATLYFNNTILTKKELESNWIIPVNQSWLAGKIPLIAVNA